MNEPRPWILISSPSVENNAKRRNSHFRIRVSGTPVCSEPLAEIAPEAILPGQSVTVAELLAR